MKACLFFIILTFIIASTLFAQKTIPVKENSSDQVVSGPKRGELDEKGKLVFYRWGKKENSYKALKNNYGMMIFNAWESEEPTTKYELYIQNDRKIIVKSDLAAFLKELSKIPGGEILDFYDTCTLSRYHELDEEILEKIRKVCKQNNIILKEGQIGTYPQNIICTCSGR